MKLKNIIDVPCGIRFCFENLALGSSYSRRYLLEMEMMESKEEIISWHKAKEPFVQMASNPRNSSLMQTINLRYFSIKDIRETLQAISRARVADDIELFEVKNLAMGALAIQDLFARANVKLELSTQLNEVIDILDPDHNRILAFYVYDSYSPELSALRSKIKCSEDSDERQALIMESQEIEVSIRRKITRTLKPFAQMLSDTLYALVKADILLAQARLSKSLGLTTPTLSEGLNYSLKGMFNPQIKDVLERQGKTYQSVDIDFGDKPMLIIGANMGGKTVVLKTLVLAQYLTQFGFDVPAQSAMISIKKGVFFCAGDSQNELEGLSSFAAEMKKIDEVIKCPLNGDEIIAFIDEPARSTNPIEGTALVSSLINILNDKQTTLLMTTHYNIDSVLCRRMKVKGLENGKMNYSLEVSPAGEVPHEALSVAQSLGISPEWLEEARKILNN